MLNWNKKREPGMGIGCIHCYCPTCGAIYDAEQGHKTRKSSCWKFPKGKTLVRPRADSRPKSNHSKTQH